MSEWESVRTLPRLGDSFPERMDEWVLKDEADKYIEELKAERDLYRNSVDNLENHIAHTHEPLIEELKAEVRTLRGLRRCPEDIRRINELELRYKVATGLLLSWSEYPNREWMEDDIDQIIKQIEGETK